VETPCDNHDNITDSNGSNDFPPLVSIIVDRNNTILWLWGPSESDSQHGVVSGPYLAGDKDEEKVLQLKLINQTILINQLIYQKASLGS
jgi:hypothetical protein